MKLLVTLVALIALMVPLGLAAQEPGEDGLPERLDLEWILKFEQSYGIRGLYIDEPPPRSDEDVIPIVRAQLVELTRAGRQFVAQFPNDTPTPQLLYVRRIIERPVRPPQGVTYEWIANEQRFTSSLGSAADLRASAWQQLDGATDYRKRVVEGDENLRRAWMTLFEMEDLPELLRREIQTRDYFMRVYESRQVQSAKRVQELLQQLSDAIEMATVMGTFEIGEPITMQDVGRTGFIDLLEALPHGGRYRVTRAGEPPVAMYGDIEIELGPNALNQEAARIARRTLEDRPGYPPALAIKARAEEGEEALRLVTEAIEAWPDVPALRIQRLFVNARAFRLEAMNEDLDYLLARFPAAPILLEIDMATRAGELSRAADLRVGLARTMAGIRPEVLLMQLIALGEARRSGNVEVAVEIFERVVERHPGYEAPLGGAPMLEEDRE